MRGFIIALLVVGALLGGAFGFIAIDSRGEPEQAGTITAAQRVGVAEAEARQRSARETLDAPATKQILFGDVHAHTTFSMDAFAWSLPVLGGEGVHPPADACDYARFVAQLDFWAHTDHAESLTPRHWQLIRDTVRACNAAAGDPANPDLVTFLGWEWTQMGNTAETHYGHRNIFLLHDDEDRTPTRPIAAAGVAFDAMRQDSLSAFEKYIGPYLVSPGSRQRQFDQRRAERRHADTALPARVNRSWERSNLTFATILRLWPNKLGCRPRRRRRARRGGCWPRRRAGRHRRGCRPRRQRKRLRA